MSIGILFNASTDKRQIRNQQGEQTIDAKTMENFKLSGFFRFSDFYEISMID